MNTSNIYTLVGVLCLVLATSVLSLPAPSNSGDSLPATDNAVGEHNHTSTASPSAELEPQATEQAESPEVSDEDMETSEVLVFRPLFRYRQIQADRRRRLEERRRKASNPY